jgi:hypothetical protein
VFVSPTTFLTGLKSFRTNESFKCNFFNRLKEKLMPPERTPPSYGGFHNEGHKCWLGYEAWSLDDALRWAKVNLKQGSVITIEPYKEGEGQCYVQKLMQN